MNYREMALRLALEYVREYEVEFTPEEIIEIATKFYNFLTQESV